MESQNSGHFPKRKPALGAGKTKNGTTKFDHFPKRKLALGAGKAKSGTAKFDHFPKRKPALGAGKAKNGTTKQSKSWHPKTEYRTVSA